MLSIRQTTIVSAIVLMLSALDSARSADAVPPKNSASEAANKIAPFLDDDTVAVVHVDVSILDVDKLCAVAAPFLPAERAVSNMKDSAKRLLISFQESGVREFFVVISSADVPEQTPFLIVPLGRDANEEALAKLFVSAEVSERIGDALFVGGRDTHQRLAIISPIPRPDLARALTAIGPHQVRAVFMPSGAARRVVEELMPTLPTSFGGEATTTITRGILWSAIGVDASPEPALHWVIQSQTDDAAVALRTYLLAQARQHWVGFDRLQKSLLPNVQRDRLSLAIDSNQFKQLATAARPAIDLLSSSVRRRDSTDSLKRIGLAMHNYADRKKHFPPAAIADANGQPLLSWRVAVLPYLGEEALFQQFHLDEPWDSKHNRKLINRIPAVFRSFGSAAAEGQTCYVVPVGSGSVFDGQTGTAFARITDGTSNTVMAIEIGDEQAVAWTKPDDYKFDPKHPAVGLTSPYPSGMLALFCDGSVRFLKQPLAEESLRRILVCDDGEPAPDLQ